jgi:hypothetical protein
MTTPTEHLRVLAGHVVDEALARLPLRAALLVGSGGRGDADFYSDLDLLFYLDAVPPIETLTVIREAVGGTAPTSTRHTEEHCGEEFLLRGVRTEVSFTSVTWFESRLDEVLDQIADFDSPSQKVLSGLLEGLPLYGPDLVERWRSRVREYPQQLRPAMIEQHWNFFPFWYYGDAMAARDTELWRLDMLLDAAFNLLAVLAALNRLYFTRFELKRMRDVIAKMEIAPPGLADRIEALFGLPPTAAATELGKLVAETHSLVSAEIPDLALPLPFPPGHRQRPWSV